MISIRLSITSIFAGRMLPRMRLPSVLGVAARLEGPAPSSPEVHPEVLGPRCGAHQLCQFQGETILRMFIIIYF